MNTIVRMTWKEMLRKRVVLLTIILTVLFLLAFWFLARTLHIELSRELVTSGVEPGSAEHLIDRFMQSAIILMIGFFFGSFVLAFLSIFSSVSVVAGEAEQGVLQALMPRPISRERFYLGRWLGIVSVGVAYALLLFLAVAGITAYHSGVPGDVASLSKAFLLFASVVPLLVSAAMLGSCYLSAMGNGVFMTMLFGAGWLGGMLNKVIAVGMFESSEAALRLVGGVLDMAMPADALQRRMLAELFLLREMQPLVDLSPETLGPFALVDVPSDLFLLYASGYTALALLLGVRAFRRKDL
ncbi:ABC transporter permease subunit [Paenibacillus sp. TRM 82003]|nr:ABC transporter permease subunit [Paenibacillus sp. TRM 82003]